MHPRHLAIAAIAFGDGAASVGIEVSATVINTDQSCRYAWRGAGRPVVHVAAGTARLSCLR
jgi:hypothetical protein